MNLLLTLFPVFGNRLKDPNLAIFYQDFADSDTLTLILVVGIVIAIVVATMFYGIICNFLFSLSKRWLWILGVTLVGFCTYFVSVSMALGENGGDQNSSTGVFEISYHTLDKLNEENENGGLSREVIGQRHADYVGQFDESMTHESLPRDIALLNAVYAIISFLVLSFVVKRYTRHGKAIPFYDTWF